MLYDSRLKIHVSETGQQLTLSSTVSSLPQNKQQYLLLLAFLLSWESLCNVALVAFTKLENQKGR